MHTFSNFKKIVGLFLIKITFSYISINVPHSESVTKIQADSDCYRQERVKTPLSAGVITIIFAIKEIAINILSRVRITYLPGCQTDDK